MPMVDPRDRVAVFIDGQFFIKGLDVTFPGQRFDFSKIAEKLVAPGRLVRAWYYDAPPPGYLPAEIQLKQKRFLETIGTLRYFTVCWGRIQERTRTARLCGESTTARVKYWEQKGVDVRLAIDMLAKAHRGEYDAAVLISGDNDFVDLVTAVKEMGKHVFNATCPANPGRRYHPGNKLRVACDDHILMNETRLVGCERDTSPSRP